MQEAMRLFSGSRSTPSRSETGLGAPAITLPVTSRGMLPLRPPKLVSLSLPATATRLYPALDRHRRLPAFHERHHTQPRLPMGLLPQNFFRSLSKPQPDHVAVTLRNAVDLIGECLQCFLVLPLIP